MKFTDWLSQRGLAYDCIEALVTFTQQPDFFENPERIMNPDPWFYFVNNTRYVVIGHCPNGDGIALDTEIPGSVVYINGAYAGDCDTPISGKVIQVASSLQEYVERCQDESFPYDFYEAKAEQDAAANP